MPVREHRRPDHDIDPLFVNRWSPRAYTGEEIPDTILEQGFEAARWAPSARNAQPWRFIYSKRQSPSWAVVFGLLNERNRLWADKASALIAVLSKTTYDDGSLNHTHSFDAGAAWANLAHQLFLAGWHTRAIGGFDRAAAGNVLGVPEGIAVDILVAVGRQGTVDALAEEFQVQETPNGRRPLTAFVSEGVYRAG